MKNIDIILNILKKSNWITLKDLQQQSKLPARSVRAAVYELGNKLLIKLGKSDAKIKWIKLKFSPCNIKDCTLNINGVCNYKSGVSWVGILNCPNPEVFQKLEINKPGLMPNYSFEEP